MNITKGEIISFDFPVWTRESNDTSSRKLDVIEPNEKIEIKGIKDDWFETHKGWSMLTTSLVAKKSNNKKSKVKPKTNNNNEEKFDKWWEPFNGSHSSSGSSQILQNPNGIFGLPYQYMGTTDRKIPGTKFGRLYSEKILSRMPLLLLSPGRPNFMKGYGKKEKDAFLSSLITSDKSVTQGMIDAKDGQLYTFEYSYKDYYNIVNSMCAMMSKFLNIHNYTLLGKKISNFDWSDYSNRQLTNFIQSVESVAFYVDAETQVSETLSNSTKESMLSSTINSVSEMGQELQFLLGGAGGMVGANFDKLKAENYDATMEEIKKFTDKYTSILPGNLVDTLTQGLTTIIGGGKMAFPEIWNDSNISRGYDISIKLRTPDCDNLSWFLNIGVPLIHLIAFAAPQQMGANGYRSPFLVRGYYKSIMNCQMGIITNMSIQKGDKKRWTLNGLPTEVNVNFNIKDLYDYLNLSVFSKSGTFNVFDSVSMFQNTIMVDYLATLCGININKPDIMRTLDLYKIAISNKVSDMLTFDRFMGVRQKISNMASTLFK